MTKTITAKQFEAFIPKMPTPEEHRQVALQWLERVQPTLIDQWTEDLVKLSIPTSLVKIDVELIWNAMCDLHDQKPIHDGLKSLSEELDELIGWRRKFIRLNSRSPKDSMWPYEFPATISGKEAVMMLMGSMRVMDDLMEFRWLPEQSCYVAVRDFDPLIRGENEFRCFIKDGGIIAVTHYDYTKPTPEWVRKNPEGIRSGIESYFSRALKPALHIDTVVADLAMMADGSFKLIEINPYGLSDPCHFGNYKSVENASSFIEMGCK
jgi:hypothetical protein